MVNSEFSTHGSDLIYSRIIRPTDTTLIRATSANTKFTVPEFDYEIVERSPQAVDATIYHITHPETEYDFPELLQTQGSCHVAIAKDGLLTYREMAYGIGDLGDLIPLGLLTSVDNTTIRIAKTIYLDSSPQTIQVLGDGVVNVQGKIGLSFNDDLSFNISGGIIRRAGINYDQDTSWPHFTVVQPQQNVQFFYVDRTGKIDPVIKTGFDRLLYDNGELLPDPIPQNGNKAVVEEVYISATGQVFVLRPQDYENSFNVALVRWYSQNLARPAILQDFVRIGIVVRVSKEDDNTTASKVMLINYR